MMALMLCGCGNQNTAVETTVSDEGITLWVVTEETVWDGMNNQAKQRIEEFEAEHENITLKLDILPTTEDERGVYLENLRAQIMAGGGPDAYLLPTSSVLTLEQPQKYTYVTVEQLFPDVNLAMYNGLFADISRCYNIDEALNKDGLETAVMNAGVIEDARYVLPLRYNIPVIFAHIEALESSGLDMDVLASGILGLMETTIAASDPYWACSAEPMTLFSRTALSCFSETIDYKNQEVLLTVQELVEVMESLQTLEALKGEEYFNLGAWSIGRYIQGEEIWDDYFYSMFVGSMNDALSAVSISNALEQGLTMIPLRATDGDLVANVTYYAAVGAGSNYPELAYEFLRGFLTEEYQWELNRPEAKDILNTTPGMIENSWPVRSDGAAEYLFSVYRKYYSNYRTETEGYQSRRKKILSTVVTDQVIPVLQEEIDRARFQIEPEWNIAIAMGSVTEPNVDIDALAEEIIRELEWHVAEG